jgi:hypothetical protein
MPTRAAIQGVLTQHVLDTCSSHSRGVGALIWMGIVGSVSVLIPRQPSSRCILGTLKNESPSDSCQVHWCYLQNSTLNHLACLVPGSVWLAPFEGTKQRVQAGVYGGVRSAFKGIVASEGLAGLYRGYSAQVSISASYQAWSRDDHDDDDDQGVTCAGDARSCVPRDSADSVSRAQVMRDLAYHAIQLPLYEGVKEMWLKAGWREGADKRRREREQRAGRWGGRRPTKALEPW